MQITIENQKNKKHFDTKYHLIYIYSYHYCILVYTIPLLEHDFLHAYVHFT